MSFYRTPGEVLPDLPEPPKPRKPWRPFKQVRAWWRRQDRFNVFFTLFIAFMIVSIAALIYFGTTGGNSTPCDARGPGCHSYLRQVTTYVWVGKVLMPITHTQWACTCD